VRPIREDYQTYTPPSWLKNIVCQRPAASARKGVSVMIGRRHFVVLVSVLCLSTTGAFAQDDSERMAKVLCLDDPECLALAKHRLTADNLRKMFAVDRELVTLMKEIPDLERRMGELASSIDPQRKLGKVILSAQVHDGIPEIALVFRRHKTTGHEYMLTYAVAMVTAMIDDSLTDEVLRREGERASVFMTPALKFWRSMDPALKAEAVAWKKMRGYDKGFDR
jgi:hypothetical protein